MELLYLRSNSVSSTSSGAETTQLYSFTTCALLSTEVMSGRLEVAADQSTTDQLEDGLSSIQRLELPSGLLLHQSEPDFSTEPIQQLRLAFLGSSNGSPRHGGACVSLDCSVEDQEKPLECHVALQLMRESVLGASMGSPRKRRCVRFDLDPPTLAHSSKGGTHHGRCSSPAAATRPAETPPVEGRRLEVLGSRNGTPPRITFTPQEALQGSERHASDSDSPKLSLEALPQSPSTHAQKMAAPTQLTPHVFQSCGTSALPSPLEKHDISKKSGMMNYSLLERLLKILESDCRKAEHARWQPGMRVTRRAASEKLHRSENRKRGGKMNGTAYPEQGQSDSERRRAYGCDQDCDVPPLIHSPASPNPAVCQNGEECPTGDSMMKSRTVLMLTGQGAHSRGSQRRLSRKERTRLGARMTLDEASLEYYAGGT